MDRATDRAALFALLTLFLAVVPASEAAAAQSDASSGSLLTSVRLRQLQVLAQLEHAIPPDVLNQVEGLRGYDLADKLDEIGRSPWTHQFMIRCWEVMSDPALVDLTKSLSKPELVATVHPSLVEKIERLATLLQESLDLVGPIISKLRDDDELSKGIVAVIALLDDRNRPVAERRLCRHTLRGMSAMFCMASHPDTVELQSELLNHAIVGYESSLRMIAGALDEQQRARVVALGLAPVERADFDLRAEHLASARKALDEAQEVLPGFQLPPDPAFLKGPQD